MLSMGNKPVHSQKSDITAKEIPERGRNFNPLLGGGGRWTSAREPTSRVVKLIKKV